MARFAFQRFTQSLILSFLVLAFVTTVSAQVSTYDYPEISGDLSTICSAFLHVPDAESESLKVEVLASKGNLRRNKLVVKYWGAKQSAADQATKKSPELLIVISGLGSEANSVYAKFYAQKAQDAGMNVLVFPNTLTPNFILSSSTRGLVGDTQADSVDLYRAIRASVARLEQKRGVSTGPIKILGFSHGALLAAGVDSINQTEGKLDIRSVMMVNPPVSLLAGLRNLDARAKMANKIPVPRLIKLGLRFRKLAKHSKTTPTTSTFFNQLAKDLRYKPEEAYAIIGLVMRMGLDSTIIAGQKIENLEILPELSPEGSVVRKQEEAAVKRFAASFSFEEYIDTFFAEQAKRDGTSYSIEALEKRSSLPAFEDYLRHSNHTFMVHNADDILLRKGDVEWLNDVFGKRGYFYPRGGHMGNVWATPNVNAIHEWLLN